MSGARTPPRPKHQNHHVIRNHHVSQCTNQEGRKMMSLKEVESHRPPPTQVLYYSQLAKTRQQQHFECKTIENDSQPPTNTGTTTPQTSGIISAISSQRVR